MPATLKSLVHLLRLMFRARWDIIEPRRAEAKFKAPSKERCAEIVGLVLCDFEELSADLANLQLSGDDAFHALFDPELWQDIDACAAEWLALAGELKTKAPDDAKELAALLTSLRNNNAKWMNIGATQFSKAIARYAKLG